MNLSLSAHRLTNYVPTASRREKNKMRKYRSKYIIMIGKLDSVLKIKEI